MTGASLLRVAQLSKAFGGNVPLAARFFEDVEHHLVMQANGFGRAAVGDPAVPDTVRLAADKETVWPFDGGDCVVRTRHSEGEPEHVLRISTEAVERRHQHGLCIDLLR